MKNLKVFMGIFVFQMFLTTSCSDSVEDLAPDEFSVQEQFVKKAETMDLKPAIVVKSSLEEINEALIENGLDPVSEEQLSKASSYLKSDVCDNIALYGDISGNGFISTLDVVIATQALSNCDGNDNGSLTLSEIISCSSLTYKFGVWNAGHIEHTGPYGSNTEFTTSERQLIFDYVLGTICNP